VKTDTGDKKDDKKGVLHQIVANHTSVSFKMDEHIKRIDDEISKAQAT
tara:strand:- start:679 stop:822 length:144 start_codon:yes stop_codon:yes gene_type:complete